METQKIHKNLERLAMKDWLTDNAVWLLFAFVVLAVVLHVENAEADTNVYLGGWSKHLVSDSKKLRENHRLYAVEHNDWFAGKFTNSHGRESYALAHKFEWSERKVRAGFYVGAVRGYTTCFGHDDSNNNTCPMAVPFITYDAPIAPKVMLIGEAVALTIKIRL